MTKSTGWTKTDEDMKPSTIQKGLEKERPLYRCIHCGGILELFQRELTHYENCSDLMETYVCIDCENKYVQFWESGGWEEGTDNKGRGMHPAPSLSAWMDAEALWKYPEVLGWKSHELTDKELEEQGQVRGKHPKPNTIEICYDQKTPVVDKRKGKKKSK